MTPLQKLPKNAEYLGTLIVAKGFKSCPKSNKSPNLVTLFEIEVHNVRERERGQYEIKREKEHFREEGISCERAQGLWYRLRNKLREFGCKREKEKKR